MAQLLNIINQAYTRNMEGRKMKDIGYIPVPRDKRDPNRGLKMAMIWVKRDESMTAKTKKELIIDLNRCLDGSYLHERPSNGKQ